ncbi:uncharacterized protein YhfF [Trueperella bonasi]|uniref:Uncharacterized protein YhfF n=1 Tax=Trueperella bonasi TaxID=312286 RepID=A0ABT9NFN9_9ACTO|nr:ASCH domain-containing protein [Trueperella bonasi]MDP9806210.1 uncharacterized protein YhfF [Trueperella bonasi]
MSGFSEELPIEPVDGDLESFWVRAITRAKLNPIEAVGGQTNVVSLRPGAFAFGDSRTEADDLAELVLAGTKTATTSYGPAYELECEEWPAVDDLWIMCDGEGRPRALLCNTRVEVVPFSQVDAQVAHAEGEADLERWRAEHRELFAAQAQMLDRDFDPEADVVVEYFKVLYSH